MLSLPADCLEIVRNTVTHLLDVESSPHIHNHMIRIRELPGHIKRGRQRNEQRFACASSISPLFYKVYCPLHRSCSPSKRTHCRLRHARTNRFQTFAEFGLRGTQFLEGGSEMLELVVQLLLHLAELLCAEGGEVDCLAGRGLVSRFLETQGCGRILPVWP